MTEAVSKKVLRVKQIEYEYVFEQIIRVQFIKAKDHKGPMLKEKNMI